MGDDQGRSIVHRELDTGQEEPATQIAEIVAELDGVSAKDLKPTYRRIDDTLEHIFSNPPSPEAQLEVIFSYESYRITVEQSGHATFVKVG